MKSTDFKEPQICPTCRYQMDASTEAHGDNVPKPGDVSFCLRCAQIFVYRNNLTLRVPTEAEERNLRTGPGAEKILQAERVLKFFIKGRRIQEAVKAATEQALKAKTPPHPERN